MTISVESRAVQIVELNDQTARLMGFKKVHYFMGKLCVQIEGDTPNNNIPWSPATDANQAMQIMSKFKFHLYYVTHKHIWKCFSDEFDAPGENEDPLFAICIALIEHAKLG